MLGRDIMCCVLTLCCLLGLFISLLSGELFAKCPVDDYPGMSVEGVLDSSRYFVLKIEDDSGMCVNHFNTFMLLCSY